VIGEPISQQVMPLLILGGFRISSTHWEKTEN
jgi:hypothetical protein